MKKISIIVATYNSDRTLRQLLDSIRYQTYKNYELIIIDGGSTDCTLQIIKNYSDIVTKYISERDEGIYDAFNKGIEFATGDYLTFIGSDDCYHDYTVFEDIVSELDTSVDVLSTMGIAVTPNGYESVMVNSITHEDILTGRMLPHAGMYVKRDIMRKYKFNIVNRIISDYEFVLRYTLDGGEIERTTRVTYYFSLAGISTCEYGTSRWRRILFEHLILANRVNLDYRYVDKLVCNLTDVGYKQILVSLFNKLHVLDYIKLILGKNKKHRCQLKYCRWCKRE